MYGIEEKVRIQLHKTHIIYKQSVIYHSTCVVIKNNPIFSLINHSTLLAIADQSNKDINNFEARSAMEYMLQVNEWLKNVSHPYCLTKRELKDKNLELLLY